MPSIIANPRHGVEIYDFKMPNTNFPHGGPLDVSSLSLKTNSELFPNSPSVVIEFRGMPGSGEGVDLHVKRYVTDTLKKNVPGIKTSEDEKNMFTVPGKDILAVVKALTQSSIDPNSNDTKFFSNPDDAKKFLAAATSLQQTFDTPRKPGQGYSGWVPYTNDEQWKAVVARAEQPEAGKGGRY